jgi:hypothetical protein
MQIANQPGEREFSEYLAFEDDAVFRPVAQAAEDK